MTPGATWDGRTTRFALAAPRAERVTLCLFDARGQDEQEAPLEPHGGGVWACHREDAAPGRLYGFRVDGGPALLDPYGQAIAGEIEGAPPARSVVVDPAFDWRGDRPPRTPWRDTVLYECHVKAMTQLHPEVPVEQRGTYLGLCAAPIVEHLQALGVTALELLPVAHSATEPHLVRLGLTNHWGYNPIGLFAPDARFATGDRGEQVREFKTLVRELHAAGIEVILDVVFNHTAEGGTDGRTLCFRGIDEAAYYHLDPFDRSRHLDWTGCGNTFNTSSPLGRRLLFDCLRHWVEALHVDGFRFDLAPTLARETSGAVNDLLETLRSDRVLGEVKLIAEPWDVGPDGYRLGRFPPGWAEWNDRTRDAVRRFWRGDGGLSGELATRLAGSSDVFEGRWPLSGINYVACHDGFPLADLVSYERKHNEANGEQNRDGTDANWSANWGVEGPTRDERILDLRARAQRNMLATLACAQGVPMLSMGDELGRTQGGNNNAYCQDNETSWVDWRLDPRRQALLEFTRQAFALRRRHPALRRDDFFSGLPLSDGRKDLCWRRPDGGELAGREWQATSAFALQLHGGVSDPPGRDLLILLNAWHGPVSFRMPPGVWEVELETEAALPTPTPEWREAPARSLTVLARTPEALSHGPAWAETGDRVSGTSPRGLSSDMTAATRPSLSPMDLHLIGEGKHRRLWERLGARCVARGAERGVAFSVWAPEARAVSVVGGFCDWEPGRLPMRLLGQSGVWERFVPDLGPGELYKFALETRAGDVLFKADPMAQAAELPPKTASIVAEDAYPWDDAAWLEARRERNPVREPMAIYEVQLSSWARVPEEEGRWLTYRELAPRLVAHARRFRFTHIELLPIMEHPFGGSWGYQVTSYFAPTARHGSPDDLRFLIDTCHKHGVGVILDWVPAHFPKDEFALARFDGSALYEHDDPRRGEHADWDTLIFNTGRHEVRGFLVANALYWLESFHADGLRVDAVASMLYLDYSKGEGEWLPNVYGGRENLESVALFRELNGLVKSNYPGCVMIAEESTAWEGVTQPVEHGGLGFTFKWNMGWMHDTLGFLGRDAIHRKHHVDQMTFAQLYERTEHFLMPLSHDEVVHGKGSLLGKMAGDRWQQLANLRILYTYLYTRPGKKLLFMGAELAQDTEWNHDQSLPWHLADLPEHAGIGRLLEDLGFIYSEHPCLWRGDPDPLGFSWIDCSDHANTVLSYVRRDRDEHVVVVLNLTPVPRSDYRIGAPTATPYRVLLDSNAPCYGGSDFPVPSEVTPDPVPCHGYEQSLRLQLPPLGVLVLGPVQ